MNQIKIETLNIEPLLPQGVHTFPHLEKHPACLGASCREGREEFKPYIPAGELGIFLDASVSQIIEACYIRKDQNKCKNYYVLDSKQMAKIKAAVYGRGGKNTDDLKLLDQFIHTYK